MNESVLSNFTQHKNVRPAAGSIPFYGMLLFKEQKEELEFYLHAHATRQNLFIAHG